jgi:hypothetical protein
MWYKEASVSDSVGKVSDELIINRIRKEFLKTHSRFPCTSEQDRIFKRVKNFIKKRYNSIYYLRKELLERKINNIINEVFEVMNLRV